MSSAARNIPPLRRATYADLEAVPATMVAELIRGTLEVYVLGADRRWGEPTTYRGTEVVRAVPFDAIALDLSALWM